MPSRPVVFTIVIFWLAASVWLFCREVLPRYGADQPPRIQFDLADEVNSRSFWKVLKDGNGIGTAQTNITRKEGGDFEMEADFVITLEILKGFVLRHYTSSYVV